MITSLVVGLLVASNFLVCVTPVFIKGAFHQHATQPCESCHRAAFDIDACGPGCMHEQDDGGTDADTLIKAITSSGRGYQFVGLVGNEELSSDHSHSNPDDIVTLHVMENQMSNVCIKGTHKCENPCDPVVPSGSGPWLATKPHINNLHREYIEGVPGVFVQHPTTDPQRLEILAYMKSGQDNIRGMEVYNSWVDQAWEATVPLDDSAIDYLYPDSMYAAMSMKYWDDTTRALKRPVYGLADDDGFVYTGDCDESVYDHAKRDVQTDTASWFRFGMGWSMVDVPSKDFNAADVSNSVDKGHFYGSTGVTLEYNISGDILIVSANEPVVFGVTGGAGERNSSTPLVAFNLTLCEQGKTVTNVGCPSSTKPPPLSRHLQIDLHKLPISAPFFFVRIQAFVRTRYPITKVPSSKKHSKWTFEVGKDVHTGDFLEGRLARVAGGIGRRPFLVESSKGRSVTMVNYFSEGYGDITPDQTNVTGIVAGRDELIVERWAWMQPVFRSVVSGSKSLVDPFLS